MIGMIEEVTGSGAGDLMSRWWPGRRSGLVVAVLAVALVAASCGGGDSEDLVVPTTTTAAATPPRSGPMSIPMALSSRSARPDRSRTAPMRTNSGTASKVWSSSAFCHRPGSTFSVFGSKVPVRSPMNEKARAVERRAFLTIIPRSGILA